MKKWVYTVLIILIPLLIITGCSQEAVKKEKTEPDKPVVTEKKDKGESSEINMPEGKPEIDKSDEGLSEENKPEENDLLEEKNMSEKISKPKYYSPFSGQVIKKLRLQRAVMVSIENAPRARPQSGLSEASIVYEFLVEGGITRFLALYWSEIPDKIGPIRSLRPYLIHTAREYDPLLLHAGASPAGFKLLNEVQIEHLDQIFKGSYYWRSNERKTPHNLYTADFMVNDYLNDLTGWKYKPRFSFQQISFFSTGINKDRAEKIVINYWGNYKVFFKYDSDQNNYKRFLNGFDHPHLDSNGRQLKADNIIVQFVDTDIKDEVGRLRMKLQGEGKALIFRNGVVVEGEWQKDGTGYTKFYNNTGKRVNLNPGQTWIQVVPESAVVNYRGD